ncbi:hypothetical protein RM704_41025 [Streptomyces sp. DSM 3412]|uniref:Uncharacterized protein n=1 Tax=Streptomyces gottesmaniae TaxID=3075518 RepID=A0ABU2ZAY7_9ACTN|nr:hypothetical protein [Streptomyces sp. DSM 3412]MDT0573758.1 hypothetical protein [Streptomyces sp. DSM 3412]
MKKNTRLRRLVVGDTTWHWTVRQLPHRVTRGDCHLKLSLYPGGARGRRLVLLFRPSQDRVVSNCYFDSGALVRLSDHAYLNLHEPGTVRRLLDAAAPDLDLHPRAHTVERDGWPYFDAITETEAPLPVPGRASSPRG